MRTIFALFVSALLLVPAAASAHAFGASLEATSTPYFIDIGYDPDPIQAGRAARFEIELRDLDRIMVQDHEYVWVRILRERETILATGIHRQFFGPTTLLYTFEESGPHTIDVSYRTREGKELAQAEFLVDVVQRDGRGVWQELLIGAGALAVFCGAALIFVANRRARGV